jgi:hypothetical protein
MQPRHLQSQPGLFEGPAPGLPEGFTYRPEFLSGAEEQALLEHVRELPFREFEFHGFLGKRRIVSFGWRYDFNGGGLQKTDDMPYFVTAVRRKVAFFAPSRLGSRFSSPSTVPVPPSAGTRTAACLARSWAFPFCPPALSGCAAEGVRAGSGRRSVSNHTRPICSRDLHARTGSIVFQPSRNSGIR